MAKHWSDLSRLRFRAVVEMRPSEQYLVVREVKDQNSVLGPRQSMQVMEDLGPPSAPYPRLQVPNQPELRGR